MKPIVNATTAEIIHGTAPNNFFATNRINMPAATSAYKIIREQNKNLVVKTTAKTTIAKANTKAINAANMTADLLYLRLSCRNKIAAKIATPATSVTTPGLIIINPPNAKIIRCHVTSGAAR